MSIVSSSYVLEHAQADGRRYVIESHTDHLGAVHRVAYLAGVVDYEAIMQARVVGIEESLAEVEYQANIATDTATIAHITKVQILAKFRAAYRNASREELAKLATWVIHRVTAGDVTEAQLQNAFGLTDPQYATLRAKMITLKDHWEAVQAAEGE